jgi:hypothetical protein
MKGTAILFQSNQRITFIEDVDHTVFETIKQQYGCSHCSCKVDDREVDFGKVSPVFWHEEEVDWEYGY